MLGIAKHSETLNPMVVYLAKYGDGGLWTRPAEMWNETVTRDGKTFPRFAYEGCEACEGYEAYEGEEHENNR